MIPSDEAGTPWYYKGMTFNIRAVGTDDPNSVKVCADLLGVGVGVEVTQDVRDICVYSAIPEIKQEVDRYFYTLKAAWVGHRSAVRLRDRLRVVAG